MSKLNVKIMKIIKQGSVPQIVTKITCNYCKAVLEYDKADIVCDQRDGNYIKCPCCERYLNV